MGFKKSQTGKPSRWGAARLRGAAAAPFGQPIPQTGIGRTGGVGQSRRGVRLRQGGRAKPTPDASERAVPNRTSANPAEWALVDANGKAVSRSSPTAYDSGEATRENAIVNLAYQRGGYAG